MSDDILSALGINDRKRERNKEKKPLNTAVSIAYRCEVCGQIFARCHPKDPQTKCEKCRGHSVTVSATDFDSVGSSSTLDAPANDTKGE